MTAYQKYLAKGLADSKYRQSRPEVTMANVAAIARICHRGCAPKKPGGHYAAA